jgi:hypothetical protein
MLVIGRALRSGPQLSPDARDALAKRSPFPSRLGRPEELAALVDHVIGNR